MLNLFCKTPASSSRKERGIFRGAHSSPVSILFSNTLYFLYSKENIGSSFYYKDCVDGIVFLSSFPCASDSLVNELAIRKLKDVPVINIIIDDSTATSGLMTRLESFVDIIKARRDNG